MAWTCLSALSAPFFPIGSTGEGRLSFELAAGFRSPRGRLLPGGVFDGEERWHTIGRAEGIVLLLVVHCRAVQRR